MRNQNKIRRCLVCSRGNRHYFKNENVVRGVLDGSENQLTCLVCHLIGHIIWHSDILIMLVFYICERMSDYGMIYLFKWKQRRRKSRKSNVVSYIFACIWKQYRRKATINKWVSASAQLLSADRILLSALTLSAVHLSKIQRRYS